MFCLLYVAHIHVKSCVVNLVSKSFRRMPRQELGSIVVEDATIHILRISNQTKSELMLNHFPSTNGARWSIRKSKCLAECFYVYLIH